MNNYKNMMEELKSKIEDRKTRLDRAIDKLENYSEDIGLIISTIDSFSVECKPSNRDGNIVSFGYEFSDSNSSSAYEMKIYCENTSLTLIIGSVYFEDQYVYSPGMPCMSVSGCDFSTGRTEDFVLGLELLVDNIEELLSPMVEKALEK